MMFSSSTHNEKREAFTIAFNIPTINIINTYLGLPTAVGKSKFRCFSFLLDRLRYKLNTWKENTLSYAGRATMIKVVAHVIPYYVISYFLLPKSLYKKMESLNARF